MFFEIDDVIWSYDFLENVGTLYNLRINLLNEKETILDSSTASMEVDLTKMIYSLKNIISKKIENITDKSEKQKKEIFAASNSVLTNLSQLVKKRSHIINQFTKRNIITKSEKFFDAPKKITESIREEKSKKERDRSVPKYVKVPEEKFNLVKEITNKNKDLGTTINSKRYTLNDANDLVNRIAKQKIGKNKAIDFYNNLMKKAEQISELRSTLLRQQMLTILNYLGEIFKLSLKQMMNNQSLQICLN